MVILSEFHQVFLSMYYHYLCKGLIIVTVPIVMDLKEEWLFLACSVFGWVKIVCVMKNAQ